MNAEKDMNRALQRELRLTRICCILSSALTLCLLAGMLFIGSRLKPAYDLLEETVPVLEGVDWEQLSDSLHALDTSVLSEALESLDMDALSAAMENLDGMSGKIEELNEKYDSMMALFGRP